MSRKSRVRSQRWLQGNRAADQNAHLVLILNPACQVFAVDEEGEEYLLDVSFRGVRIGNDGLVELASADNENRSLL